MAKNHHQSLIWKPKTSTSSHLWNLEIHTTNQVLKLLGIGWVKSRLKLPKWLKFAQSGHTASIQLFFSRLIYLHDLIWGLPSFRVRRKRKMGRKRDSETPLVSFFSKEKGRERKRLKNVTEKERKREWVSEIVKKREGKTERWKDGNKERKK